MALEMHRAVIAMIALALLPIAVSPQPKDCTDAIISLASCTDFVTGRAPAPSSPCCSQLATVVQSEPECLCVIINGGGSQFGISINRTLALALPSACHVVTPPVSRCNDAAAPLPAIVPSTGGSSNGGDSTGSFLRPTAFPFVFSIFSILMACNFMFLTIF